MVITMMAMSEPGTTFVRRGVSWMMRILPKPMASVGRCTAPIEESRTPHFGMNSFGSPVSPKPKRSLTCVVKIVTAIPAVKPKMMG